METLQSAQSDARPRRGDSPAIEPLDCSAVLTHHWLVRRRGGEKVLEALCELLPDSPIYTLVYDPSGFQSVGAKQGYSEDVGHGHSERAKGPRNLGGAPSFQGWGTDAPRVRGAPSSQGWGTDAPRVRGAPSFQGWGTDAPRVRTSFLQHIPGAKRHYPKLLPLMALAARRIKLPPVDLVVCSDAAIAKAMTPDPRSKVICYCHSPMRYVWDLSGTYRATLPFFARPLWGPLARRIRAADRRAAERVDQFVANSHHVAGRIRRHYGRDSIVVHPPVDLPSEPATGPREDFYLCVGQHVPYKRLDLAVEACHKLGRKLVVIGEGPDVDRFTRRCSGRRLVGRSAPCATPLTSDGLRDAGRYASAGPTVKFLGHQPDEVVRDHYRRAKALLFPGEEDFGIVPVEAMAHGCPVIAYGVGGATESVVDGKTGILFEQQTVDCLAGAIERAETGTFDPVAMHAHTLQFAKARFLWEMRQICEQVLTGEV